MKQKVIYHDLGQHQPYKKIWDLQEELLQQNVRVKSILRNEEPIQNSKFKIQNNEVVNESAKPASEIINHKLQPANPQLQTTNYLLFVEHNPVYTLGKSGNISHVLINENMRSEKGIEFFRINRGGDITFHGPGQLVGYPIFDLDNFKTDLGWYLRSLEDVIILTMAEYGLKGARSAGETGVWIDPDMRGRERKICAMGIRCSRWITMHGFAFNVNTDLQYFDHIIPCGIQNKQVTSLQKELGETVSIEEVKKKVKRNFEKVFDVEIQTMNS